MDVEPLLALATTVPGAAASGLVIAALAGLGLEIAGRRSARARVLRRLRADAAPARPRRLTAAEAAAAAPKPSLADRVVERATRAVGMVGPDQIKQARMQLMRAGYFDSRAVALYFLARAVGAVAGGATVLILREGPLAGLDGPMAALAPIAGAALGWLLPSFHIGSRTKTIARENRAGFPDFMDLMGVCANAGMSMEAALERVSRELADMYPTLGVHLQILCLEVRAGRSLEEALHALADRLDIAEVRAFATLLQQSKELGSSLTDALRVFSDDMRHKRLALAEEKAYALPAKLSVPVTGFILPVVLFAAILPVIVRIRLGLF